MSGPFATQIVVIYHWCQVSRRRSDHRHDDITAFIHSQRPLILFARTSVSIGVILAAVPIAVTSRFTCPITREIWRMTCLQRHIHSVWASFVTLAFFMASESQRHLDYLQNSVAFAVIKLEGRTHLFCWALSQGNHNVMMQAGSLAFWQHSALNRGSRSFVLRTQDRIKNQTKRQ